MTISPTHDFGFHCMGLWEVVFVTLNIVHAQARVAYQVDWCSDRSCNCRSSMAR